MIVGALNTAYCGCFQVRAVVDEQREALGYGTHQVLFNTDLFGKTSGTYKPLVSTVHFCIVSVQFCITCLVARDAQHALP